MLGRKIDNTNIGAIPRGQIVAFNRGRGQGKIREYGILERYTATQMYITHLSCTESPNSVSFFMIQYPDSPHNKKVCELNIISRDIHTVHMNDVQIF